MATDKRRVALSNLDRLSSLPDELIYHIMWFLRAKQAVKTSILSKRWKNLWRYLPELNFNRLEFNCDKQFIDFVNSFFNRRENTNIDMFRLDWEFYLVESEPTKTWIVHVLNFQPRLISIRAIRPLFKALPDSLFACSSLEAIDFQISCSIVSEEIRSKPINLVNLKRLNLNQVHLSYGFIKKLISGSPRLEELIMEYCPLDTSDITITSHSLKILVIKRCICFHGFAIHLSAPNLLLLHVIGADLGDIRLKGMPSLRKACVHYNQIFCRPQKSEYELLRALSNVSHLELIGKPYMNTTKSKSMRISVLKNLLEKELLDCGAFVNLKHLHLSDWCMSDDFGLIASFIKLSPNLETLTLSHEKETFLQRLSENFYIQIQFKRSEMIEIKCSIEHERVNELISTLKAHLGTFKEFSVDINGNFSTAFCKAAIAIVTFTSTTAE